MTRQPVDLDALERTLANANARDYELACVESICGLIVELRETRVRALAAEARLGRPLIAPAGLGRITTALARLLHATYLDGPPDEATCDEWRDVVAAAKSEYDGLLRRLADDEARLAQAPGDDPGADDKDPPHRCEACGLVGGHADDCSVHVLIDDIRGLLGKPEPGAASCRGCKHYRLPGVGEWKPPMCRKVGKPVNGRPDWCPGYEPEPGAAGGGEV